MYAAVTYGPLADTPVDPDVVFLRLNAKQLMVLCDAVPGLRIEGKRGATSSPWRRRKARSRPASAAR